MPLRLIVGAVFFAVFGPCLAIAGQNVLIPETTAARYGLTRPWFTQLQVAQERARVTDVVLHDGVLYIQTDTAVVQAVDAETGRTHWARQIGRPGHLSITPAANNNLLAVVNGSRLYVVNRRSGALLLERAIDGVPVAGVALSLKRVYIPMMNGLVISFPLDQLMEVRPARISDAEMEEQILAASLSPDKSTPDKSASDKTGKDQAGASEDLLPELRVRQEIRPPISCQSAGAIVVAPVIAKENRAEEYVAWCSEVSGLNIASVDRAADDLEARLDLRYRMAIETAIPCSPVYLPADPKVVGDSGILIIASNNGFVHAVLENKGENLWRFSTGESIVHSPVAFNDRLYVATVRGGLFCVDIKNGKGIWRTPDIVQFVAASKSRVYGVDSRGQIVVLNAENGARLDAIPAGNISIKFCNSETDRIYLVAEHGLIQCLREIDQTEPIVHQDRRKQGDEMEEDAAAQKSKSAEGKSAKKGEDKKAEADPQAEEPADGQPAKKDASPKKKVNPVADDEDPFK